jgi:hypothetical protein
MEFKGEVVKKAHKFTRMMTKWYKNIDYRTEFGIIMQELLNGHEFDIIKTIVNGHGVGEKEWNKYGKSRIYYSVWAGKYQHQYGYWDMDKEEYVIYNKYTKQHNLYDLVA